MNRIRFSTLSIKIWMGFVTVLLTITVMLVMTLSNVAPRVDVIPQLFTRQQMNFNQLVEVTNMNAPVKEKELIDEMLVRFYIENRINFIPDKDELTYRYGIGGPIHRLSAPGVYGGFMAQVGNFEESLEGETGTRMADILGVSRDRNNTFTVDFDVYEYNKGSMTFGGRRRATVRISYSSAYRQFGRDFANPYGMVVISYRETGLKKW